MKLTNGSFTSIPFKYILDNNCFIYYNKTLDNNKIWPLQWALNDEHVSMWDVLHPTYCAYKKVNFSENRLRNTEK